MIIFNEKQNRFIRTTEVVLDDLTLEEIQQYISSGELAITEFDKWVNKLSVRDRYSKIQLTKNNINDVIGFVKNNTIHCTYKLSKNGVVYNDGALHFFFDCQLNSEVISLTLLPGDTICLDPTSSIGFKVLEDK